MIGARVEPPIAGVVLASLAAGGQFGGEPDLVTGGGAVNRLQDQLEIEGELQFADHHDRGIVAAQRHEIAAADLALDGEAEVFEKPFDRQVKRSFQNGSGVGSVSPVRINAVSLARIAARTDPGIWSNEAGTAIVDTRLDGRQASHDQERTLPHYRGDA